MQAESAKPEELQTTPDRAPWTGLAVSLLLHLLAVVILLWTAAREDAPPAEPTELPVEMVFLPAPPPPPPPVPPQPAPRPFVPPPPQLVEAPIARESNAPQRPPAPGRQGEARQATVQRPTASTAPAAGIGPQRAPGAAPREETAGAPMRVGTATAPKRPDKGPSQTLEDFILAQTLQYWVIDITGPRFKDVVLYANIRVNRDGTLARPFGSADKEDLSQIIANYDQLIQRGDQTVLQALRNFLQALRSAQPLRLPKNVEIAYPTNLQLAFRLGDVATAAEAVSP